MNTNQATEFASMVEIDDWARQAVAAVEAEIERVKQLPNFREWAAPHIEAGPWNERDCAEKWIDNQLLNLPPFPAGMGTITNSVRYERGGRDEWGFRLTTGPLEHDVDGDTVSVAVEAFVSAWLTPSGDLAVDFTPPHVGVSGARIEELTGDEAIAVGEMLRISGEALQSAERPREIRRPSTAVEYLADLDG